MENVTGQMRRVKKENGQIHPNISFITIRDRIECPAYPTNAVQELRNSNVLF